MTTCTHTMVHSTTITGFAVPAPSLCCVFCELAELRKERDRAEARVRELEAERDSLRAVEAEAHKAMATKPCEHKTTRDMCSFGEDASGKSLDTIQQCTTCGALIHDYRHGGGMRSPNYPVVYESPLTMPFRQLAQQSIAAEARVRELEAERDSLREALSLSTRWCGDADDLIGTFEDISDWFYHETGYMRPGKSEPIEMGDRDEERRRAWDTWRDTKSRHVRDSARAALAKGET